MIVTHMVTKAKCYVCYTENDVDHKVKGFKCSRCGATNTVVVPEKKKDENVIRLKGEPNDQGDIQLEVILQDGRRVTILVPITDTFTWAIKDGVTYGLNLVTEWHYS